MSRLNKISLLIMRSSLMWGGLASLAFYTLVHTGVLHGDFIHRYFAGHWVNYLETIMFFVGVALLLLKAFDVADQTARAKTSLLPSLPSTPLALDEVHGTLTHLAARPVREQEGYLPRRLREALESIVRKGSADTLDDELKYLADVDAARAHAGYALLRIVIWAIPILGFLGTVIGITMAIASLSPEALEQSLPAVTAGLGVAFDTTALALGLSMALMFGQFAVDKSEQRLLALVDQRVSAELTGRFEQSGGGGDPQLAAVRWMAESVVKATERMVQKQADLWKGTIDAAHAQWNELSSASREHLETALTGALVQSVRAHAEQLSAAEEATAERTRQHWARVTVALTETAEASRSQQTEMSRQADLLRQMVDSTGQVVRLQDVLNSNLAALAGAQHLEETLLNLSATIHLLNARLGHVPALTPHVGRKETSTSGKAA